MDPVETKEDPFEAEREAIEEGFNKILQKVLPPDMDYLKVEQRSSIISALVGPTRTSVMGALTFAAFYSRFVGLDTANIKELFDEVDALLKDSPYVEDCRKRYDEMNQKAKEAQMKNELAGAKVISPGNNQVH